MQHLLRSVALGGALIMGSVALVGCGDDADDAATDTTTTTAPADDTTSTATAELTITGAWARTSPALADRGAAYLFITGGAEDDALLAASAPEIAPRVEVHETYLLDDAGDGMPNTDAPGGPMGGDGEAQMGMREVPRIEIPAGQEVALEPGGYHVMLMDLPAPLVTGTTFELTLTFEKAGDRIVDVEVREEP